DGATARPSTPRLPRAGEQLAGAAGDGRSERPRGEIRPVRLERDRDRPASTAATGRRRSAGPPALPLIVLIGVVVVLLVGVVWLVVTGADEPPTSETDGGTAGGETRGAAAPTAIELTRTPEGMQVSWAGDEEGTYVVTILSPTSRRSRSRPPAGPRSSSATSSWATGRAAARWPPSRTAGPVPRPTRCARRGSAPTRCARPDPAPAAGAVVLLDQP